MNPHLLPPKPDATLTLCCSPRPMTSKGARFQKVPVLLFFNFKKKKIMAEKENGYIAGANFVQWKKHIEWRIWNPQSNFALPSRTEKAVITWTTTLKLIYTGYYSKRPGCSLADLHPHFLFFLFGKGLQSHNSSTQLSLSFLFLRTFQGACSVTVGAHQMLVHQSSGKEGKKKINKGRNTTPDTALSS